MIHRITEDDTITDDSDTDDVTTLLLKAEPFNLTYMLTNMINAAYRAPKEN